MATSPSSSGASGVPLARRTQPVAWSIWDQETGNVLGFYLSEDEARKRLERLRAANPDAAEDFVLIVEPSQ